MVSITAVDAEPRWRTTSVLVAVYGAVVVGTLAALVAMTAAGSAGSTQAAWVHAVVVAGFAVLLPLRLRAARRGRPGAARAVRIIAAVLLVANLVEALELPLYPPWMRVEMVGISLLMALVIASTVRRRR